MNLQSISYKVVNAPKVKNFVLKQAKKEVDKAKKDMLKAFDNHKVTKEIEDGESTNNSSGLLKGYGNLFSFIGFPQGEEPLAVIRTILEEQTKLDEYASSVKFVKGGLNQFTFDVEYPNLKELYDLTPYPDGKRQGSWLEGIEEGLYGFQSYLYDDNENFDTDVSRSTTGLQAKISKGDSKGALIIVRKADAKKTDYMSKILDNFKKALKRVGS